MIFCGQAVSTHFSTFLYDYGGGVVVFLLVYRLRIPGYQGIVFMFLSLPLLPSELFQLQMIISFTFLLAKDLRRFLLIIRTRSFFTLLYVGGTYTR